jgi:ABC-2 type transport system permease protein
MAATGILGDSPLFAIDYILRFMRVALLLAIWRTLFVGRPAVAGLPLASVLTYTLISEVFAEPLSGVTSLHDAFWNGTISTRFLRPMSLFGQFAAEAGGVWAFNLVAFSMPLLLCAPLFGVNPLPATFASGLLFTVSLVLGVSVGLALDYISGAVAVSVEITPGIMERARRAIGGLLSGAIIPLTLMPWGLGKALMWTPFAALASAPLQIYIGKGDPGHLLALQAFWAIVLWPLANRLWANTREKMVSYGG